MKKFLPLILLTCLSCLTEESADQGKGSTFVRYYTGGYNDQPYAFDETTDGFIILVSTEITGNTLPQPNKIKLIKTDEYGNTEWQTLYPALDQDDPDYFYKGRAMVVEKDGAGKLDKLTIVGDKIDRTTGDTELILIQMDANGEPIAGKSATLPLDHVEGHAITLSSNGNYLVLASRNNGATKDMILAEFDKDDLSHVWSQDYGEGGSSYVTGLHVVENEIFWGGTVARLNSTAMRMVMTDSAETGTIFNNDYGTAEFNESLGGICYDPFDPFFILVGTTDENGDKDILLDFVSTSGDGDLPAPNDKIIIGNDEVDEEGNAICNTNDGGQLIIGTAGNDEAKDYYLIKLNFLGEVVWSRIFGSKKKEDKGVAVMQASDNSYVILGSTKLGGRGSTMLMKTDSQGNIK